MLGKFILAVTVIAVGLAFFTVLPELFAAWQTDEYSHGIVIPIIAALLGWHILTRDPPMVKPSWAGPVAIAIAGGLLLVGRLAAFTAAAEYGIIVALVGVCLSFLGRAATRSLAPAWIYLLFAVPLPHLTYATLSQNLQLLSSTIGVSILDLFGIPVYQDGNIIDLGGMKLQVVEACSGLRYLFPLMSFGYLIAYLLKDRLWKRVVLFLSTIPITIITNALRIALIGITVDIWGNNMAGGLIHIVEGWVIFLICTALLMAEVWVLLRIGNRGYFRFDYLGPAPGPIVVGKIMPSVPGFAALLAAFIGATVFGTNVIDYRPQIVMPHTAFAEFPRDLGDWHGMSVPLDPDVLAGLKLSDYVLADYRREDGTTPINFYMAYYDSQRIGSATHSPANCIPGGGWQIARSEIKNINMPGLPPFPVSRLIIRKGAAAQLVYYWFDERGRTLTETTSSKWYAMIDAIRLNRTDGALIRVVTPITVNEDDADRRLNDFLVIAYPLIGKFVPGASP
jgi:exosortase D (VPLPA-CTERM-specific)